ncbi:hypothetical protein DPMN_118360 [Dreissena polymorpha]|uniref:Uncharacterized protein n=1 Tax=Dreissena polymorpha TaxID=45954 RepID=A0A9D4GH89_DREPO|nr:hypothetical protein DPMN_118360 [Dreissena polymorpha]
MQSSVVAEHQVTWCTPKPCIHPSVVARQIVMPTQPKLQSAVGALTTTVQMIRPGPSPAASWGSSSYPQSSVRCSVARKRQQEEYDVVPAAKIHINKNHPRFRHLFQ